MRAIEENVVIEEAGHIEVDDMPVKPGDRVKLIILIPDEQPAEFDHYPLRGKQPYSFDDPTSPVAPEDWE